MDSTLPLQFKKHEWHYEQEVREGDIAIYRRWKVYSRPTADKDGPGAVHYEVIRVGWQDAYIDNRRIQHEAGELYPTSREWGKKGWTFKTLPEAMEKYNTLKARL